MRRLAKILLAGTAAATPLCAANAQTAQGSEAVNEQVQLGDVFAGRRLKMIDPADGVGVEAHAAGPVFSAGVKDGKLTWASRQTVKARIQADAELDVHGWSPETTVSASAVGAAGDAWAIDGAVLDAVTTQTVAEKARVSAAATVKADLSSSGDTRADSTATGASQSYAVGSGAYAKTDTLQRQYGSVTAHTDASIHHTKGQVTLGAAGATSNDTTHTGDAASGELAVRQHATGQTIASTVGDVRSGYLVDSAARATGNRVSAVSDSRELDVKARQKHEGYLRAESYLTVNAFGAVTSTAAGVGNSVTADTYGEFGEYDTDQENTGTVEVVAAFWGDDGYDADVDASAYGNFVSGSACSDCRGELNAQNRQSNAADVSATARTAIGGSSRSSNGAARAVGNSAVYTVSPPR